VTAVDRTQGGTFQTRFDDAGNQTTTLTDCMFASDLTVNGVVVWGGDASFFADLSVSGVGTAGGTCTSKGHGRHLAPSASSGSRAPSADANVAVLVPEA
jgi:hypothetical protein